MDNYPSVGKGYIALFSLRLPSPESPSETHARMARVRAYYGQRAMDKSVNSFYDNRLGAAAGALLLDITILLRD